MILLTGKSASGKTLAANNLMNHYGIKKVVTATTRKIRVGEVDKVHYYFLSKEEFLNKKDKNLFVETTEYNGNFYGCPKSEVGQNKVIVVDPIGIQNFLNLHDDSVVSFLLKATKETREERMLMRGDEKDQIAKRLHNDEIDFSDEKVKNVDFIIETDNRDPLDIAEEIYKLYKAKLNN